MNNNNFYNQPQYPNNNTNNLNNQNPYPNNNLQATYQPNNQIPNQMPAQNITNQMPTSNMPNQSMQPYQNANNNPNMNNFNASNTFPNHPQEMTPTPMPVPEPVQPKQIQSQPVQSTQPVSSVVSSEQPLPEDNTSKKKKEKKDKKELSTTTSVIAAIVMMIIIFACILYILSTVGVITFNFGEKENNTTINNEQTNLNTGIKLDENQDYVYAADYRIAVNEESYFPENYEELEIKASDIIVPYININSTDAENANREIYSLYESLINSYNDNLQEKVSFTTVDYNNYINNDILSVVITTHSAGTSIPVHQYYTYNFNIQTGSLLNYENLLTQTNNTKEQADKLVADTLSNYIHNMCDGNQENSNQHCNDGTYEYENLYNASVNTYNEKVSNNTLNFYFENNNTYVVLNPMTPAQNSGENILFNINTKEEIQHD